MCQPLAPFIRCSIPIRPSAGYRHSSRSKRSFAHGCDWIDFGNPPPVRPEFANLGDQWKREDSDNGALKRLVQEDFVRSRLIAHISNDLAVGAGAGWDVSVDRLHGRVIGARFARDASLKAHGFALPILIPRVVDLTWEDVVKMRRLKALKNLRAILRDVEIEAFEVARSQADLESATLRVYANKMRDMNEQVENIISVGKQALVELLIASAAGYATVGLAGAAIPAGAGSPRA